MSQSKPLISISSYTTSCRKKKPLNELNEQLTDNSLAQSSKFFVDANKRRLASSTNRLPELSQIKGPTGSVRGHKNVVRKSIENIRLVRKTIDENNNLDKEDQIDELVESLQMADEEICVVYVTSLGVIRRTFEDSRRAR